MSNFVDRASVFAIGDQGYVVPESEEFQFSIDHPDAKKAHLVDDENGQRNFFVDDDGIDNWLAENADRKIVQGYIGSDGTFYGNNDDEAKAGKDEWVSERAAGLRAKTAENWTHSSDDMQKSVDDWIDFLNTDNIGKEYYNLDIVPGKGTKVEDFIKAIGDSRSYAGGLNPIVDYNIRDIEKTENGTWIGEVDTGNGKMSRVYADPKTGRMQTFVGDGETGYFADPQTLKALDPEEVSRTDPRYEAKYSFGPEVMQMKKAEEYFQRKHDGKSISDVLDEYHGRQSPKQAEIKTDAQNATTDADEDANSKIPQWRAAKAREYLDAARREIMENEFGIRSSDAGLKAIDLVPVVGDIAGAAEEVELAELLKQYGENPESVDPLQEAYLLKHLAEDMHSRETGKTFGANVTAGAAALLPFMVTLGAGEAMSKGITKAASKLGLKGFTEIAESKLAAKAVNKIASEALTIGTQTVVASAPGVASGALERMRQGVVVHRGADGKMHVENNGTSQSAGEALKNSFFDMLVENTSERFGEWLGAGAGMFAKSRLANSKLLKPVVSPVAKFFQTAENLTSPKQFLGGTFKKTISGMPSEWLEERVGGMWRGWLGVDASAEDMEKPWWKRGFEQFLPQSLEDHMVELAVLGVPGAVSMTGNAARASRWHAAEKQSNRLWGAMQGEVARAGVSLGNAKSFKDICHAAELGDESAMEWVNYAYTQLAHSVAQVYDQVALKMGVEEIDLSTPKAVEKFEKQMTPEQKALFYAVQQLGYTQRTGLAALANKAPSAPATVGQATGETASQRADRLIDGETSGKAVDNVNSGTPATNLGQSAEEAKKSRQESVARFTKLRQQAAQQMQNGENEVWPGTVKQACAEAKKGGMAPLSLFKMLREMGVSGSEAVGFISGAYGDMSYQQIVPTLTAAVADMGGFNAATKGVADSMKSPLEGGGRTADDMTAELQAFGFDVADGADLIAKLNAESGEAAPVSSIPAESPSTGTVAENGKGERFMFVEVDSGDGTATPIWQNAKGETVDPQTAFADGYKVVRGDANTVADNDAVTMVKPSDLKVGMTFTRNGKSFTVAQGRNGLEIVADESGISVPVTAYSMLNIDTASLPEGVQGRRLTNTPLDTASDRALTQDEARLMAVIMARGLTDVVLGGKRMAQALDDMAKEAGEQIPGWRQKFKEGGRWYDGLFDGHGNLMLPINDNLKSKLMHETSHAWVQDVKRKNPKLWDRGKSLMAEISLHQSQGLPLTDVEKKFLEKLDRVMGDKTYSRSNESFAKLTDAELEDMRMDEGLAYLIEEYSENLFAKTGFGKRLGRWVKSVWSSIRKNIVDSGLAGFENLTEEEVQGLTFDQFVKIGVADIVRDSAKSKRKGLMPAKSRAETKTQPTADADKGQNVNAPLTNPESETPARPAEIKPEKKAVMPSPVSATSAKNGKQKKGIEVLVGNAAIVPKSINKGKFKQPEMPVSESEKQRRAQFTTRNGSSWTATTPDGSRTVAGHYVIVEAGTAHNSDNKSYPQWKQNRTGRSGSTDVQVQRIAQELNGKRLLDAPTTDTGAPIVDNEGDVISGNGRDLAISLSSNYGTETDYENAVKKFAAENGIPMPDGIEHPRLYRVIDTELNKDEMADFIVRSNREALKIKNAAELAEEDMKILNDDILLGKFNPGSNGDFSVKANAEFMSEFARATGDDSLIVNGVATEKLNERIVNSIVAKLIGEAGDDGVADRTMIQMVTLGKGALGIEKVVKGLSRGAIPLLKLNGTDYEIGADIALALAHIVNAKRQKLPVRTYVGNLDMFMKQNELAADIAAQLADWNSAGKIARALSEYGRLAALQTQGTDSFFAEEPKTKADVWKAAVENVENEARRGEVETDVDELGAKRLSIVAELVTSKDIAVEKMRFSSFKNDIGPSIPRLLEQLDIPPVKRGAVKAELKKRLDNAGKFAVELKRVYGKAFEHPMDAKNWKKAFAHPYSARANGVRTVNMFLSDYIKHPESKWIDVKNMRVATTEDAALLFYALRSPCQESFKAAFLDDNNNVIAAKIIGFGNINKVTFKKSDVFTEMPEGTSGMIISHNHPSGNPTPSAEDEATTDAIRNGCNAIGVRFLDHVITNGDKFYSFSMQSERAYPKGANVMADWETTRFKLKLDNHESLSEFANIVRQGSDSPVIVGLDTKLQLVSASIIPQTNDEFLYREYVADAVNNDKGARAYFLLCPRDSAQIKYLRNVTNDVIVNIVKGAGLIDAIEVDGNGAFRRIDPYNDKRDKQVAETSARRAVARRQKRAGVDYPDASAEIESPRFSVESDADALIARRRPSMPESERRAAVAEIVKFPDSKARKAALHWFVRGAIRLPEDAPKVTEALGYAGRAKGRANTDPFAYKSPMEMIAALHDFKPKAKPISPDAVPELSDRRDMGHGVVTYLVQDDRAGQQAMRRIINTHWGEDANPWCLLHGDGKGNLSDGSNGGYDAWYYWNYYDALPKRVAFKDGKLLAFMATDRNESGIDINDRYDELIEELIGEDGLSNVGVDSDEYNRYWNAQAIIDDWDSSQEDIENAEKEQESALESWNEWVRDEAYRITNDNRSIVDWNGDQVLLGFDENGESIFEISPEEEQWWDRQDKAHGDVMEIAYPDDGGGRTISRYSAASEAEDAAYMDAVKRGDMETAQRQYDEVVARYTNADGTRKQGWMKAPNGKPTKLTERQWVQVRTENFKRWFGDWENDPANASKVVDENGEPMVVYHGTNAGDFTVFGEHGEDGGAGFYFTTKESDAVVHGSTRQFFLNAKHGMDKHDAFEKYVGTGGNPRRVTIEKMRRDGYDHWTTPGGEIAVFDNRQIKSATDNVGTFDGTNPDIRYSIVTPAEDAAYMDAVKRGDMETAARRAVARRQKRAGVDYPDASAEIESPRFSVESDADALIARWRPSMPESERRAAVAEIAKFPDSKARKAALHWFVRGAIRLPEDAPKVTEALGYASRAKGRANTDPFAYKSPMEMIAALHDFKPKAKPISPDAVPELSDRRDMGHGVVTYLVQDDRAGQQAMRRIINTHWGEDANPWCLLHGDGKGNLSDGSNGEYDAWYYWNYYSTLPKKVAFLNGRLLAFMATNANDENYIGDETLKQKFPQFIEEYRKHEYWYNGYESFMRKEHPELLRSIERAPEQWWDRKDASHAGIPIEGKIAGDPLGRSGLQELKDGKLELVGRMWKGDRKNGKYEEWEGEQKKLEEEHKDGRTVGWRRTYRNGKLEKVQHYDENGKFDRPALEFHENGNLARYVEYGENDDLKRMSNFGNDGTLREYREERDDRTSLAKIAASFYLENSAIVSWTDDAGDYYSATTDLNGNLSFVEKIANGEYGRRAVDLFDAAIRAKLEGESAAVLEAVKAEAAAIYREYSAAAGTAQDGAGNVIPLSQRFNTENPDIRYSVILGEIGAGNLPDSMTVLKDLKVAKAFLGNRTWEELARDEKLKIKTATGWEKGKEGKWRREGMDIPDIDMKLFTRQSSIYARLESEVKDAQNTYNRLWKESNLENIEKRLDEAEAALDEAKRRRDEYMKKIGMYVPVTLREILGENHDVMKAYPWMYNVPTRLDYGMGLGQKGNVHYEDGRPFIAIAQGLLIDPEQFKNTLTHEIQHIIQLHEAFGIGGNSQLGKQIETAEEDEWQRQYRETQAANSQDNKLLDDMIRMAGVDTKLDNLVEESIENHVPRSEYNRKRRALLLSIPRYEELEREVTGRIKKREEKLSVITERRARVLKYGSVLNPGYGGYFRISGEVESRNAGRRTENDRVTIGRELLEDTEDVAREDQVIVESARDQARYSVEVANPWPADFPNVMVQTTLHSVKEKYGDLHAAAKAGDAPSAAKLIEKIVKPEKVKALAARHPNAIVAYVHAEEATGRNKIPEAYASYISNLSGLARADGIVQTVRAHHTGASANDRLTRDAQFDGPVEAGREYILIDDHVTMGTTLNELRNYIKNNGGKVVEISTLTASQGSTIIALSNSTLEKLESKFGELVHEYVRQTGIAGDLRAITESEGRYILKLSPDSLRNRIAEARRAGGGEVLRQPLGASSSAEVAGPRFSIEGLYTGSAADYEKPSLLKVGTGEGTANEAWGLYATEAPGVAGMYASQDVYRLRNVVYKNGVEYEWDKKRDGKRKIKSHNTPESIYLRLLTGNEGNRKAKSHKEVIDILRKNIELVKKDRERRLEIEPSLREKEFVDALRFAEEHGSEYEVYENPNQKHSYVYEQTMFTNRPEGDMSHLIDWNANVGDGIISLINHKLGDVGHVNNGKGVDVYNSLSVLLGGKKPASEFLRDECDIDGIVYDAPTSEGYGHGNYRNYVSFRDDNINVDHKWVDGVRRFSIVGENAKLPNAVRELLDEAKTSAGNYARPGVIWKNTGWWKGPDGKWRYEIANRRLGIGLAKYWTGFSLGDDRVMDALAWYDADMARNVPIPDEHKTSEKLRQLLELYPSLGDIGIEWISDRRQTMLAQWVERLRLIRVNRASLRGFTGGSVWNEFGSAIIHELQHAIQDFEGFEYGDIGPFHQKAIQDKKLSKALKDLTSAGYSSDKFVTIQELVRYFIKNNQSQPIGGLKDKASSLAKELEYPDTASFVRDLQVKYNEQSPFEQYRSQPGEMDARLAQYRNAMTDEERAEEPPFVTLAKMRYEELHDGEAMPEATVAALMRDAGLGEEREEPTPAPGAKEEQMEFDFRFSITSSFDSDARVVVVDGRNEPVFANMTTAEIRTYLREKYRGREVTIRSDGTVVEFTVKGLESALKKRGKHRRAFHRLDALIESSHFTRYEDNDGKKKHEHLKGQFVYTAALRLKDGIYGVELKLDDSIGSDKTSFKGQTLKTKIADASLSASRVEDVELASDDEASAVETVRLGDLIPTGTSFSQPGAPVKGKNSQGGFRPSTDIDSVVENLPQFSAPGIDISELGAQVDAQARRERQIMDMIAALNADSARKLGVAKAENTRLHRVLDDVNETLKADADRVIGVMPPRRGQGSADFRRQLKRMYQAGEAANAEDFKKRALEEYNRLLGDNAQSGSPASLIKSAFTRAYTKGKEQGKLAVLLPNAVRIALDEKLKHDLANASSRTGDVRQRAAQRAEAVLTQIAQIEHNIKNSAHPGDAAAAELGALVGVDAKTVADTLKSVDAMDVLTKSRKAVESNLRAYYIRQAVSMFGGRDKDIVMPDGGIIPGKTKGKAREELGKMSTDTKPKMKELLERYDRRVGNSGANALTWDEARDFWRDATELLTQSKRDKDAVWNDKTLKREELRDAVAAEVEAANKPLPDAHLGDQKLSGFTRRGFFWGTTSMQTRALYLAGGDENSTTYRLLYETMRETQEKQMKAEMEDLKAIEEKERELGFTHEQMLVMQNAETPVTIGIDDKGKRVQISLTRAEMMTIYGMSLDADACAKLMRNGFASNRFRSRPQEALVRGVGESEDDRLSDMQMKVGAIVGRLTEQERKFVKWAVTELADNWARRGNEASRECLGYEMYTEGQPFFTLMRSVARDKDESDTNRMNIGGDSAGRAVFMESKGNNKERVAHSNPLLVRDIFRVLRMQTRDMSIISSWMGPYRDIKSVLSRGASRAALSKVIGTGGIDQINDTLDALCAQGKQNTDLSWLGRLISKLGGNASVFILGGRLTSIALNRFGGMTTLIGEMNNRDDVPDGVTAKMALRTLQPLSLWKLSQARKDAFAKLMEHPYLWNRWNDGNAFEVAGQLITERLEVAESKAAKLSKAKFEDFRKRSAAFMLSGMTAAETANGIDAYLSLVGSGVAPEKAVQIVAEATRATQNPSTTLEYTGDYQYTKAGGASTLVYAMTGQPAVQGDWAKRNLYKAMQEMKSGKGSKGVKRSINMLASLAITALVSAAIAAVVAGAAAGGDDEEKRNRRIRNRMLSELGGNITPVGGAAALEIISDLCETFRTGKKPSSYGASGTPATQAIENIVDAANTASKALRKSIDGSSIQKHEAERAWMELGEGVGMTTGLPLGGVEQILKVVCGLTGHPLGKKPEKGNR